MSHPRLKSDKPRSIFKSKQIYYAVSSDGQLHVKLSRPKSPIDFPLFNGSKILERWPEGMQVLSQKHQLINNVPDYKELLNLRSGHEKMPPAFDKSIGYILYNYEPSVGNFFTTSRPLGSVIDDCSQASFPNGHSTTLLQFESRFESGNLMRATCVGPDEYQLELHPDYFTNNYSQWFYFRVRNMQPDRKYRFTIVNFYKAKSLFDQGMRPLMYSERTAQLSTGAVGWHRVGHDLAYYPTYESFRQHVSDNSKCQPQLVQNIQIDSICDLTLSDPSTIKPASDEVETKKSASRSCRRPPTYSLTWTQQFPYANDTVYLAGCYPYTYSQLIAYLVAVDRNPFKKSICSQRVLCHSLAGNPIPLVVITESKQSRIGCQESDIVNQTVTTTNGERYSLNNNPTNNNPVKRCVVMTARVHPGETQSSWIMQGLLDFLTSHDPDAFLLRHQFVFYLVPMLNPDGVMVGNYRCSLSGCDLNRKYRSDLRRFFPPVWHTKQLIMSLKQQYDITFYCDLHGHSRRQKMFLYGCDESLNRNNSIADKCRLFPAMLAKNEPEAKQKEGTGRVVMWRQGIANSFTLEASFCGVDGQSDRLSRPGYHFNIRDYERMGWILCDTLLDYHDKDNGSKIQFIAKDIKLQTDFRKLQSIQADSSSNSGSDSSDCDDLPAYYMDMLNKRNEKKSKRRKRHKKVVRNSKLIPPPPPVQRQCSACTLEKHSYPTGISPANTKTNTNLSTAFNSLRSRELKQKVNTATSKTVVGHQDPTR